MARILLVDDDEFYRTALRAVIQNLGHEVIEVPDGKNAQRILGLQKYDLLISDIRMPSMSGIELLQWAKNRSRMPVILMTGFSEVLETEAASKIGADEFLVKPFKGGDLNAAIVKLTSTDDPAAGTDADVDDQYCKVPIEDFVAGSRIHCAIFTRVSSKRYVRIAYQGEDLEMDRIRNYKKSGMKHLYLKRDDFSRYVHFSSAPIAADPKRDFFRYASELLERIRVPGDNPEDFTAAKELVQTVLDAVQHNDAVLPLLEDLHAHADFLYTHSLAVSLYSAMIARSMGWNTTPARFKAALAGLLHDIGLKEIPLEILEKNRNDMTQEERTVYETHPRLSAEILDRISGVPEGVAQIASQHHEDPQGCGYPNKLGKHKIHPMSRLIAVADVFCEYAVRVPKDQNLSALEALQKMNRYHRMTLDPECFAAFKRAFKFDALAELTSVYKTV